ncbi:MAG TPA: DoxX family protein [Chloroflexota bacterium]
MTVSRKTTELSPPRPTTPPSTGSDGHGSRIGSLEKEVIPVGAGTGPDYEAEPVGQSLPRARFARPFGSVVRTLFGVIWLADAYFKWQPSFLNGLLDVMHDGTASQPGWLMPWFNFTHTVIAVQPTLWAYGIAIVETGIALALLLGFARKVTYLGGAIYSLLIWSTAEGFGRMSSGVATDIGTAIIYAVVFVALLALDARAKGTRPYSLDAVIERRVPWWRGVAEVGR